MQKELRQKILTTFDFTLEVGTEFIGSIVAETLVGQVLPGLSNAYLTYKQNKMFGNLNKMIDVLKENQEVINIKLANIETKQLEMVKNEFYPFIVDNIITELEDMKIQLMVNGFINSIQNYNVSFDKLILYYDLLSEIRMLDISYLLCLSERDILVVNEENEKAYKLENDFKDRLNLSSYESKYIKDKLRNKGFILPEGRYVIEGEKFDNRMLNDFGRKFIILFKERR